MTTDLRATLQTIVDTWDSEPNTIHLIGKLSKLIESAKIVLTASPVTVPAPGEGHKERCYYCGRPCNSLAGNPGEWPIALCHRDAPGKVKWHHASCVHERLVENQRPATAGEGQMATQRGMNRMGPDQLIEPASGPSQSKWGAEIAARAEHGELTAEQLGSGPSQPGEKE